MLKFTSSVFINGEKKIIIIVLREISKLLEFPRTSKKKKTEIQKLSSSKEGMTY